MAIHNGTATLTNTTVSGNSAVSGGGLNNDGGTATLNNCTVSGNSADQAAAACTTLTARPS